MKERQEVARELGKGYRQKTKKERGLIVDELVRLTGYNRTYACRALREAGRTGRREPRRRSRRKTYGPEVLVPLRKIWATMDGIGVRVPPRYVISCAAADPARKRHAKRQEGC